MTLGTERIRTIDDIRAFLDGSAAADCHVTPHDRGSGRRGSESCAVPPLPGPEPALPVAAAPNVATVRPCSGRSCGHLPSPLRIDSLTSGGPGVGWCEETQVFGGMR